MNKNDKIYVAGHKGLAGSAVFRKFKTEGFTNLITRTSSELDLRKQRDVNYFFKEEKPDYVILAAAKVGGIIANNTYPGEFLYDNVMIQTNVIHAAYENDVKKLVFLGSSCVYPKYPELPITEDQILSGKLEKTNEAYAIAKISGIKMIEFYNKQYGTDFISVMPTNLYGPNDNYHPENSHVLAALVKKFSEASIERRDKVVLWGTGKPKREFLHSEDLADAILFLIENYSSNEIINVGFGEEISIIELANKLKEITGFEGKIEHDYTKPDGTPSKVMDISKIKKLGWKPKISLDEGLKRTVKEYQELYQKK